MNKTYLLILTLGLASPLAAELTAPQLPLIDAASVRAGLTDKENINIGAAFPGMQTCAFKAAENKTCVFTCKDGSIVTRPVIVSSLVPNGCAKFVMVPSVAKAAAAVPAGRAYASRGDYALETDARAALELALAVLKLAEGVEVTGGDVFLLPGRRFGYNIAFNSALDPELYEYPYSFSTADEAEEAMAGMAESLSGKGKMVFATETTRDANGGYSFVIACLPASGKAARVPVSAADRASAGEIAAIAAGADSPFGSLDGGNLGLSAYRLSPEAANLTLRLVKDVFPGIQPAKPSYSASGPRLVLVVTSDDEPYVHMYNQDPASGRLTPVEYFNSADAGGPYKDGALNSALPYDDAGTPWVAVLTGLAGPGRATPLPLGQGSASAWWWMN